MDIFDKIVWTFYTPVEKFSKNCPDLLSTSGQNIQKLSGPSIHQWTKLSNHDKGLWAIIKITLLSTYGGQFRTMS